MNKYQVGKPKLQDQVAIVSGGGRGMGRADCQLLAAEGAIVICCDKLGDNAESVAREIREAGGRAEAFTLDITRSADVRAMVAQVAQAHGRIDILVNNAGYDAIKPFVDTTEEEWDFLIDLNLKGQLLMTHAVLPHMINASHGKIVFISSDAARVGSTNEAVYAAAKAGLLGFTKTLAREVARNNIRVNCICPGVTNTPQLQRNLEDPVIGKIVRAIEKKVPLRRFGEPEEIAGAVLFFVSDQSSFITGQVLSVSGGLTMV
jgi:2-hydroxycyclohexanecarboxyl-CoA dehydrogenase